MHNSVHGSDEAILKVCQIETLRKKLSSMFTDGLKTNIHWTFHSVERLIERFNGTPTNMIVVLLKGAVNLLESVNATGRTVVVDGKGIRMVVALGNNGYNVVTVIKTTGNTTRYEYK